MYNSCPYCYRSLGVHSHDPILLPSGAKYDWISDTELVYEPDINNRWYKGFYQICEDDVIELQTEFQALEQMYGITPLTTFSLINANGKFQITGKHIKEMRDSVEKLLTELGILKIEYFNYDEENNHITHPLGDKLDWTDPITNSEDLQKFQVKYIHIEELRHFLRTVWEDFSPTGTLNLESIGDSSGVYDSGNIQKRQYWYCATFASHEFYGAVNYSSSSLASLDITDIAHTSAIANAVAYDSGGGFVGVPWGGHMAYPAEATADTEMRAYIPLIGNITAYPLAKIIHNDQTGQEDMYHLFAKAQCDVIVTASGFNFDSDIAFVPFPGGQPIFQSQIDAWNAAPVVPNSRGDSSAQLVLRFGSIDVDGDHYDVDLTQRMDFNVVTGATTPTIDFNNFDIDVALAWMDEFSLTDPIAFYLRFFQILSESLGSANVSAVKAGDAFYQYSLWYVPIVYEGGNVTGTVTVDIDNIIFYYKKV